MPPISKSHTSPEFEAKFKQLQPNLQKIAARKILLFEKNPNHPGLKTHKLKGALTGFWSFSINKDFRVLFRFLKNNVVIYYDIDTHEIYK